MASDSVKAQLNELHNLLCGLPDELPVGQDFYQFQNYKASDEDEDLYGEEGALNHTLEVTFCPQGRQNGPIVFRERGPGLIAVVSVLRMFIEKFPGSAILEKWVQDLTASAKNHKAGATAPRMYQVPIVVDTSISTLAPIFKPPPKISSQKSKSNSTKTKKKKNSAEKSVEEIMADYSDCEPPEKGIGGVEADELLDKLSVFTRIRSFADIDPEKRHWRCIGAAKGCETNWVHPRLRYRVLKHAGECSRVDPLLKQQVAAKLGHKSLGAQVEELTEGQTKPGNPSDNQDDSVNIVSPAVASTSSSVVQFKPNHGSQVPSVYELSKKAGVQKLKTLLDYHIMLFFAVGGIPPSKADLPQWQNVWNATGLKYVPVSGSTLEDIQFPAQAAFVKQKAVSLLQSYDDLTISYDGGTTRAIESFYTVHVATPDRRIFLMEGNEASDKSHTADHIFKVLDDVVRAIGSQRFRGVTSDNTGNTSGARNHLVAKYPWLIILPDPCHRLNLLAKDICNLDEFKATIAHIKRTVRYFKKSSFAKAHLKRVRRTMRLGRGLVSVGKTRFVTMYFSGESLKRNLPAIRQVCSDETQLVKIPKVNYLFQPGMASSNFAFKLDQFLAVLAPIGKSTTCLESSHSTVSDVYVFWLAVMAELHAIIVDHGNGLDSRVKEKIRHLANARYKQMFAPSDIYLTGFVLDPRYRGADIFRDLNPLKIKSLKLPPLADMSKASQSGTGSSKAGESSHKRDDLPDTLRRAGNYLLSMLRSEYQHRKSKISGLEDWEAVPRIRELLCKYVKGVYPFDRPLKPNDSPRDWWQRLNGDHSDDAQPLAKLAVSIFSIVPNSMADERTASTFTWLNSALRNRQQVPTLVRTTQIRQWELNAPERAAPKRIPTVKFRDLAKDIYMPKTKAKGVQGAGQKRKRLQTDEGGTSVDSESESETDEEEDLPEDEADESDDDFGLGQGEDEGATIDGDWDSDAGSDELLAHRDVNLASPVLRDMLADAPVVQAVSSNTNLTTVAVTTVKPRKLEEADWVM